MERLFCILGPDGHGTSAADAGDRESKRVADFSTLDDATAALSSEAREAALDPAFGLVERPLGAGALTMRTRCWTLGDRYELRTAHIRSPKIEIFTSFLYPDPSLRMPLYAMEFVILGRKPIVAVLDAVDLAGGDTAARILEHAHREAPEMTNADDAPDWFLECRSGSDFFLRPESAETFDALAAIHEHVVSALLAITDAPAAPDPDAHAAAIADYKHHHRVNSPGLPLLNRVLGEAWTEEYMTGVFFA